MVGKKWNYIYEAVYKIVNSHKTQSKRALLTRVAKVLPYFLVIFPAQRDIILNLLRKQTLHNFFTYFLKLLFKIKP